jgi:hypothetical protein
MFANPFDNARAKIERAKRHFDEFLTVRNAYHETQTLTLRLEKQPNGDTIGYAEIERPPPVEAAAIVADVIGNLRASLDIAVSQACRFRGEANRKRLNKTYFAFGGSESDWESNLDNRMAGADQVIRDAVRRFKPWAEDGNPLLYALAKIAADDKHVQLVPIATRGNKLIIDGFTTKRPDGKLSKIQVTHERWISPTCLELFTVFAPAEVEISGPAVMEPKISFGDVHGIAGHDVSVAFLYMGALCERIINDIEKAARS